MRTDVVDSFPDPAVPAMAYELHGIQDRTAFLDGLMLMLTSVIPCDAIGWNAVDAGTRTAEIRGEPAEIYESATISPQLLATLDDHPMVNSYLADPRDSSPRRISDLISGSDLKKTRTYGELMAPLKVRHMLTVLTAQPARTSARCWTFARHTSDFGDSELARAVAIQPVLAALDRNTLEAIRPREADGSATTMRPHSPFDERARLTPREIEVLAMVATGRTAAACGHLLRISPATVSKHLENIYEKLGCHDRLLAVDRARRLGYIPPSVAPTT